MKSLGFNIKSVFSIPPFLIHPNPTPTSQKHIILHCGQGRKESDSLCGSKNKLRTRDVAQVVEHLPCKCKALRSNPSPTKKKKKKKRKN
jgi:hypothetical protein